VIVSRGLAQRYWKGESALGKRVRMRLTGPWYTVVGVVGSVHGTALEQPPEETIYSPIVSDAGESSWTPRQLAIVVRAAGDPAGVAAPVRNAIHSLDPALPVYRVRPMDEILSRASARTSLTLLLLGTASVMAMVLGAVGIYGVIAYMVSLRTREIGVRLALGAQPAAVSRMVALQGVTAAATGIAVGLVGAAVVTRVLAALLFQVSATDPMAFVGAAALLFVVALLASWLPARRAASVAPAEVLRRE
jgi:predicted lysophospholipase L1 biosynthesis ABC-type transport system permease subunit